MISPGWMPSPTCSTAACGRASRWRWPSRPAKSTGASPWTAFTVRFWVGGAEPAGLDAFVGFLRGGGTVAQVKAAILGSAEYFQRNGGTNDGFVTALYRDVLGRTADAEGRQAFTRALAAGVSRGTVALAAVSSRESLERIVQGWYRQYLRRGPDPGGLSAFAGFLQAGGREEVAVAILLSSAEFGAGL